jgi:hypothetical protein
VPPPDDAVRKLATIDIPNTGTLRDDVLALLRSTATVGPVIVVEDAAVVGVVVEAGAEEIAVVGVVVKAGAEEIVLGSEIGARLAELSN